MAKGRIVVGGIILGGRGGPVLCGPPLSLRGEESKWDDMDNNRWEIIIMVQWEVIGLFSFPSSRFPSFADSSNGKKKI